MTTRDFERARELFERAFELAAEERSAFLANECHGDYSLQHEVESLLRAHDDAGEDQPQPQPTPGEQPGERIDRYKLLQELGEGGMGSVWMAAAAPSRSGARSRSRSSSSGWTRTQVVVALRGRAPGVGADGSPAHREGLRRRRDRRAGGRTS